MLSGLSPRGRASLAQLERTRLWPGAAAEALHAWHLFIRDPMHRLWNPDHGCGIRECCPDPEELRHLLELVAHALPRQDARFFRQQLAALNDEW
ncbi:hypothetical protein [Amycolatopsis sp. 195334CR]|uniref:hypothetical protein n=1 Tax=Amycolatopsis sp. 195334CR TaxID=2814588 RepID=UPI001A8EA27B|nr:hypothetical protein [Amycolatopsis sp. 195334CR]MBN6040934.1 hypothetical protein [Amycolatopsis sp. 195334CR]